MRRTGLALLFCVLLFCASSAKVGQMPIAPQWIRITLEPAKLSKDSNHLRQTGKLLYLAGWTMRSDHPDFGGWSAMVPHKGGLRLVSDAGAMLDIPLPSGSAITGKLSEVPKGCGFHWIKEKQDTESLTVDPVSGQSWIGLENTNLLCRFSGERGRATSIARPEMKNWQITYGPEAMVRLRDGRMLVFAEADPDDSGQLTPVLVFKGDPRTRLSGRSRRSWTGRGVICRLMQLSCRTDGCLCSTACFRRASGSATGCTSWTCQRPYAPECF